MNFFTYVIALVCIAMSSLAQIAMKYGMSAGRADSSDLKSIYLQALLNSYVWLGIGFYGLSAVIWLWVLTRLPVSVAYPMVSLGFILTMLIGKFFLYENVSWQAALGGALILIGVTLIASTHRI